MPGQPPIITLLTDFGTADSYAAAMKGAILTVHPEARIVDLTHEAPAHDIRAAAFLLKSCYPYFPRGTIHVAVVDPGVGGSRLPIILTTAEQYFIGPDNGIFTYVIETEEVRDVRSITARHYMRETVSPTFHGRDVFAPAAAYLARGVSKEAFGEPVAEPVRFELPRAVLSGRTIRASVLHVDRFGNVVLCVTRRQLEQAQERTGTRDLRCVAGGAEISGLRMHYEGAPPGRPFFLFGSAGYLEIAADRASAAALTGLSPGDEVQIELA